MPSLGLEHSCCVGSPMAGQGPFWLQLGAPAVSILVSFGPSWLHMSVGFVLQPPFSLSSVRPLEFSLQPQPHFHSLARPPNLGFLVPIWRSFCVLWLFDSPHWSLFRRVWVPLAAHFASSGLLIASWDSSWLSFASQGPKICAFWSHLEGQFKLRAPVWRSFHAPDLRP